MEKPVIRLLIPSVVTRRADGSWHGTYPSTDVDVIGATKEEVARLLGEEMQRLHELPGFKKMFDDARAGIAVPDGWVREEIAREEYERRILAAFERSSTGPTDGD